MNVINITRGELTPEEKTAINVLASVVCDELDCDFCPLSTGKYHPCIADVARKLILKKEG